MRAVSRTAAMGIQASRGCRQTHDPFRTWPSHARFRQPESGAQSNDEIKAGGDPAFPIGSQKHSGRNANILKSTALKALIVWFLHHLQSVLACPRVATENTLGEHLQFRFECSTSNASVQIRTLLSSDPLKQMLRMQELTGSWKGVGNGIPNAYLA